MDWARAKNVLITVFILLNIFLSVNLIIFYRGDSAQGKNTINAVKILEDRGVVLKCKIPEISDSYRISYENAALDTNSITSLLLDNGKVSSYEFKFGEAVSKGNKSLVFQDNSSFTYLDSKPNDIVELNDKGKVIKYCVKFLNNLKLPVTEYYTDKYIKHADGSINIIFKEKIKNYIIFSNEFHIEISERGIKELKCKLVKIDRNQSNKDKNIVPAYQILLRHYLGSNNTIVGIDIGFDCEYVDKGKSSSTYPIWRVRTEDGNERYFKATDGSEKEM